MSCVTKTGTQFPVIPKGSYLHQIRRWLWLKITDHTIVQNGHVLILNKAWSLFCEWEWRAIWSLYSQTPRRWLQRRSPPGSVCDITVAAPIFSTVCGVESLRRNQYQITKLSTSAKQPCIFISFSFICIHQNLKKKKKKVQEHKVLAQICVVARNEDSRWYPMHFQTVLCPFLFIF